MPKDLSFCLSISDFNIIICTFEASASLSESLTFLLPSVMEEERREERLDPLAPLRKFCCISMRTCSLHADSLRVLRRLRGRSVCLSGSRKWLLLRWKMIFNAKNDRLDLGWHKRRVRILTAYFEILLSKLTLKRWLKSSSGSSSSPLVNIDESTDKVWTIKGVFKDSFLLASMEATESFLRCCSCFFMVIRLICVLKLLSSSLAFNLDGNCASTSSLLPSLITTNSSSDKKLPPETRWLTVFPAISKGTENFSRGGRRRSWRLWAGVIHLARSLS